MYLRNRSRHRDKIQDPKKQRTRGIGCTSQLCRNLRKRSKLKLVALGVGICLGVAGVIYPLTKEEYKTRFITPNDELVAKYSGQVDGGPEDIYDWLNSNFRFIIEGADIWSTPHEMLSQFEAQGYFQGDCGDISFLATSMFRAIGVPPEDVRNTFGYAQGNLESKHSWTTIKIDGNWIPLEFGPGRRLLDYLEERHPYTPVISWNDKCRWTHEENKEIVNIFLQVIERHTTG